MVLLKAADLYIIDEPLAGIDVSSKATVMQAILEFTNGKTLIVIMHGDFQFYNQFDRIFDLAEIEIGIRSAAAGQDASQPPPTTSLCGA